MHSLSLHRSTISAPSAPQWLWCVQLARLDRLRPTDPSPQLTLLLALLPALPALGATTESLQLTTPPTRTCKYTFPDSGFTYDLCPLFASEDARRGTTAWETPTPPSITATEYRWSLDGPLRKDGTLLDRNQVRPPAALHSLFSDAARSALKGPGSAKPASRTVACLVDIS